MARTMAALGASEAHQQLELNPAPTLPMNCSCAGGKTQVGTLCIAVREHLNNAITMELLRTAGALYSLHSSAN